MNVYKEIFHLLKSDHVKFCNNKLINTNNYTNCVNATSNLYYRDSYVNELLNKKEVQKITIRIFIKRFYKISKMDNLTLKHWLYKFI